MQVERPRAVGVGEVERADDPRFRAAPEALLGVPRVSLFLESQLAKHVARVLPTVGPHEQVDVAREARAGIGEVHVSSVGTLEDEDVDGAVRERLEDAFQLRAQPRGTAAAVIEVGREQLGRRRFGSYCARFTPVAHEGTDTGGARCDAERVQIHFCWAAQCRGSVGAVQHAGGDARQLALSGPERGSGNLGPQVSGVPSRGEPREPGVDDRLRYSRHDLS